MRDDLLQIRSFGVCFYALRDGGRLYLIDGGFLGGISRLGKALRDRGWSGLPIAGILLTHGHLDHICHVARLAADSGAWIAAPRLDAPYYRGTPVYRGPARVTGLLERAGRRLTAFAPFAPSRLLDDGDPIDVWHGLETVHLPGHTAGHSGFYCRSLNLLFCGDLFASFGRWSHFPPGILNADSRRIADSASKALALGPLGILPNHADRATPAEHLQQLRKLCRKHCTISAKP